MPPGFHFDLAAKLSPFTFHEKIDAIFIWVFCAVISEFDLKLSCNFLCVGVMQSVLGFIEVFKHIGAPGFSGKRNSSL